MSLGSEWHPWARNSRTQSSPAAPLYSNRPAGTRGVDDFLLISWKNSDSGRGKLMLPSTAAFFSVIFGYSSFPFPCRF